VDPEGIDTLISQPTIIEGDIQGIPIDPDQLLGAELNTYWDPTVSNARRHLASGICVPPPAPPPSIFQIVIKRMSPSLVHRDRV